MNIINIFFIEVVYQMLIFYLVYKYFLQECQVGVSDYWSHTHHQLFCSPPLLSLSLSLSLSVSSIIILASIYLFGVFTQLVRILHLHFNVLVVSLWRYLLAYVSATLWPATQFCETKVRNLPLFVCLLSHLKYMA